MKGVAGIVRLERVEQDAWINAHVPLERREKFETSPDKITAYHFTPEALGVLHEAGEAYLTGIHFF